MAIVTSGLIRHYILAEGADPQVAYDSGSQAENGTLGTTSSVEATDPAWEFFGNHLMFSRVNSSQVSFPSTGLPTGNSDLTIMVLAELVGSGGGSDVQNTFWSGESTTRTNPHIHFIGTSSARFGTFGDDLNVTGSVSGRTVLTFRYTSASTLVQGTINDFAQSGSRTIGGAPNWTWTAPRIGGSFPGYIYTVLVYDRVLSNAEVSTNYAALLDELDARVPPIATLTPNGHISVSGVVDQAAGTTDLHLAIDDSPDTSDGDTTYLVNSASASGHVWVELSNTPSDFAEMLEFNVRVRVRRE